MTIEVLDPTSGESTAAFAPAPRPERLTGLTVGIVSNGKHGTVGFFDALAEELRHRHGVAAIVRVVKPNYSAPAGDEIMHAAQTWHALVAGVGD